MNNDASGRGITPVAQFKPRTHPALTCICIVPAQAVGIVPTHELAALRPQGYQL